MVANQSNIQELRTRLEISRWQLHDGIQQLENRLNGTSPRTASHRRDPRSMRWMALSIGAGLVMVKAMPWLLHGTSRRWFRRMFPGVARAALLIGLSMMNQKKIPSLRMT